MAKTTFAFATYFSTIIYFQISQLKLKSGEKWKDIYELCENCENANLSLYLQLSRFVNPPFKINVGGRKYWAQIN